MGAEDARLEYPVAGMHAMASLPVAEGTFHFGEPVEGVKGPRWLRNRVRAHDPLHPFAVHGPSPLA